MGRRTRTLSRSAEAAIFAGILVLALALRVGSAVFLRNYSNTDEVYQYLEPAHRLVFGYGIVAWEFREGLRSWIISGFIAGIMRAAATLSDDPKFYLGSVAAALSLLALPIVAIAYAWGRRFYGVSGAIVTALLVATWPELVYFAPKALSDVIATDALVLAVFLIYPAPETRHRATFFAVGFCLGLAFALRYQLAPIYALVALYACQHEVKRCWLPLVLGAAGPVLAAGLLDWISWGHPFQSMWMNYYNDIVVGVTAAQGVEPWYWYIGVEVLSWSGALVPILIFFWLGARRAPFLALLALVVFVFFTLIGHKIYRYVYPALPFVVVLVGLGTSEAVRRLGKLMPRHATAFVAAAMIGWPLTSAALAVDDNFQTYFHKDGAVLDAFDGVGRHPDLCGVGVIGLVGWLTPGYTYLHRDVPIYLLPVDELSRREAGFNYLIVSGDPLPAGGDFSRLSCAANTGFTPATRETICVYRRSGACAPAAGGRTLQDAMHDPA
jgi:hypothetical protein